MSIGHERAGRSPCSWRCWSGSSEASCLSLVRLVRGRSAPAQKKYVTRRSAGLLVGPVGALVLSGAAGRRGSGRAWSAQRAGWAGMRRDRWAATGGEIGGARSKRSRTLILTGGSDRRTECSRTPRPSPPAARADERKLQPADAAQPDPPLDAPSLRWTQAQAVQAAAQAGLNPTTLVRLGASVATPASSYRGTARHGDAVNTMRRHRGARRGGGGHRPR